MIELRLEGVVLCSEKTVSTKMSDSSPTSKEERTEKNEYYDIATYHSKKRRLGSTNIYGRLADLNVKSLGKNITEFRSQLRAL